MRRWHLAVVLLVIFAMTVYVVTLVSRGGQRASGGGTTGPAMRELVAENRHLLERAERAEAANAATTRALEVQTAAAAQARTEAVAARVVLEHGQRAAALQARRDALAVRAALEEQKRQMSEARAPAAAARQPAAVGVEAFNFPREVAISPPGITLPGPITSTTSADFRFVTDQTECVPDQPCRVKVFFATDRNLLRRRDIPEQYRNLKTYFGGDRQLDSAELTDHHLDPVLGLWLGECFVTIPDPYYKKFTGKLDYATTYDAEHSVFIKDVQLAGSTDAWVRSLRARVETDPAGEMFVFIHGFNVSFADAARRTAQIYYDLGFKGAPVVYSWPSGGKIWNYWADEASVEWSSGHLRQFLDLLARESHAKKIHLIAHSMGNRALTRALAEIGLRNSAPPAAGCKVEQTKFREVILAAPDLDTDLFVQLDSAIRSAADRITLYASKKDRAVLASWILHRFRRLGYPSGRTPPPPAIDAIDASAASSDFLGHSYYGESILWDIQKLFSDPAVPIDQRGTLKRAKDSSYYSFVPQRDKNIGAFRRAWKFMRRQRSPNVIAARPEADGPGS